MHGIKRAKSEHYKFTSRALSDVWCNGSRIFLLIKINKLAYILCISIRNIILSTMPNWELESGREENLGPVVLNPGPLAALLICKVQSFINQSIFNSFQNSTNSIKIHFTSAKLKTSFPKWKKIPQNCSCFFSKLHSSFLASPNLILSEIYGLHTPSILSLSFFFFIP